VGEKQSEGMACLLGRPSEKVGSLNEYRKRPRADDQQKEIVGQFIAPCPMQRLVAWIQGLAPAAPLSILSFGLIRYGLVPQTKAQAPVYHAY